MRALAVPVLLAAAFAFACGGDDDTDQASNSEGGSQPTQAGGEANRSSPSGASGAAVNTSVVTIGGERYEVTLTNCVQLGGATGAVGRDAGKDLSININLPPKGWESSKDDWSPPSIRVRDDGNDKDWRAGGDIVEELQQIKEGQSQVDSYTIDGKRATGTATFVETYAVIRGSVQPVQGTFEINCK